MKNILIAEDEEAIRDFVVINLKRAGYKVTDVDNGLDAITAYDNAEEPFDVVIPVSYTHLDVYKRQPFLSRTFR